MKNNLKIHKTTKPKTNAEYSVFERKRPLTSWAITFDLNFLKADFTRLDKLASAFGKP